MHFYHKHNWNPDNRTSQHQPSKYHRPSRIMIAAISHRFPLIEAEGKDELVKEHM